MKKLLIVVFLFAACATAPKQQPHIARVWHGVVPAARANEYQAYLYESGIKALRATPGNLGADMFRRETGDTTEFIVISYWPSEESIRAWAGENLTRTRLMGRDREFLINPELEVKHFVIAASSR